MLSFPGYKSGVVVKLYCSGKSVLGGCVSETLLPLLMMPGLCSALVLTIKIRVLATLASGLQVGDPWHKIYQMSSSVNNDFNPHSLPNILSWSGEKLMVWTLQGD